MSTREIVRQRVRGRENKLSLFVLLRFSWFDATKRERRKDENESRRTDRRPNLAGRSFEIGSNRVSSQRKRKIGRLDEEMLWILRENPFTVRRRNGGHASQVLFVLRRLSFAKLNPKRFSQEKQKFYLTNKQREKFLSRLTRKFVVLFRIKLLVVLLTYRHLKINRKRNLV